MTDDMPARGLDTRQAGAYLGLAKSTMERMRVEGNGPAYAKYGGAVRYYRDDLDVFRQSRMFRSTSEYGGLSESGHG